MLPPHSMNKIQNAPLGNWYEFCMIKDKMNITSHHHESSLYVVSLNHSLRCIGVPHTINHGIYIYQAENYKIYESQSAKILSCWDLFPLYACNNAIKNQNSNIFSVL